MGEAAIVAFRSAESSAKKYIEIVALNRGNSEIIVNESDMNAPSKIDSLMEYAIRLADVEQQLLWEDLNKLADLTEEIASAKEDGVQANAQTEAEFQKRIKLFFNSSGQFRNIVEHCAKAKRLIQQI